VQADGELGYRPLDSRFSEDRAWDDAFAVFAYPWHVGPSETTLSRWEDDGGR